ncbi:MULTISPECIES: V-type ATP synthase subunit D [unclassified Sedimentibacter]|uniref:V-type ATP synthase subunit D n=1 Tax=unclassified Sedimentibacter TaxID=2649220 RepID=UPI0027E044BF|nr:V-type ATP synthase subunit D [Sedimentibacter sp. MB35-C1]WMJ78158.1 V-type ATP synthase subunit D [Sedimentibacter sp. MB35-C1]
MARLNVNPTRMVLTSLKKRLKVAVKGHKMLKDKRDELMKQFLELARENKVLREKVDSLIGDVYSNFVIASAVMSSEVLNEALMYPKQGVSIEVSNKNVMSVDVPVFDFKTTTDDTSNIYPYGFANTSAELDSAIENLSDIFPEMLKLAAVEKEVQLLAAEIEKTRRRVNALEYVMIPQFQETIKYIQMKLDENERGNQTRLMKVKDMMVQEAIEEKQEFTKAALDEFSSKE